MLLRRYVPALALCCLLTAPFCSGAELSGRLRTSNSNSKARAPKLPPAVLWVKPLSFTPLPRPAGPNPVMLQKNKMFFPHLVVVPVGGSISFPNADPFFHNVFSLFDGKRFDLGLYEAGSTRSVAFTREGVSYIFCNIHPEMSSVVVSLATPYYAIADPQGQFHIGDLPDGEYELHVWVEGERPATLDRYTRKLHVTAEGVKLGDILIEHPEQAPHLNKFGQPYDPALHEVY